MSNRQLTLADADLAAPARARNTARRLALGAVVGPALFTLAWLVLGFLSPGYTLFGNLIAPYSPISQPISGLGLGPTGMFMNAAFVLSGLVLLAGVAGIFQTVRPSGCRPAGRTWAALLALSPLGLVVAGVFTLEAVLPHLLGFLLATGTPVVSFLATGAFLRGIPGWRRFGTWLLLGSPLTLVLLVGFFLTFDPAAAGANMGMAGLVQRVLALEVHAWFMAMGWLAYRRSTVGWTSTPSSGKLLDSAYMRNLTAAQAPEPEQQPEVGDRRHPTVLNRFSSR